MTTYLASILFVLSTSTLLIIFISEGIPNQISIRKHIFQNFILTPEEDLTNSDVTEKLMSLDTTVIMARLFQQFMAKFKPNGKILVIKVPIQVQKFKDSRTSWKWEYDPMDRFQRCSPVKKVVFMKTHKCASSTIENILFRHALRNNLNIALPGEGNYLSRVELFNRNSVLQTKWGKLPFDVFTLHNRWNYNETMALMGPPAVTFTIVRNPVNQFESLYSYMSLDNTYGLDLKNFTQALKTKSNATDPNKRAIYGLFGRNQIAFDLGINITDLNDESVIKEHIKKLDSEFELVLIAERMEESLILLADLLCWPLDYVISLELNARKPEKYVKLSQEERDVLAKWLNVDTTLYTYFQQRFDNRVAEFNARKEPNWMENQIKILRKLNDDLKNRCVIERVGNEKLNGTLKESSNTIMGYRIHQEVPECESYAMSEPAYLNLFRERLINTTLTIPNNSTQPSTIKL